MQAFAKYSEFVAPWIWLQWIPQLLTSLARPEGQTVKGVLAKVAKQYPQSIYYTIRAFLIDKRETRAPVNTQAAAAALAAAQQAQAQAQAAVRKATAAAAAAAAAAAGAPGASAAGALPLCVRAGRRASCD